MPIVFQDYKIADYKILLKDVKNSVLEE